MEGLGQCLASTPALAIKDLQLSFKASENFTPQTFVPLLHACAEGATPLLEKLRLCSGRLYGP